MSDTEKPKRGRPRLDGAPQGTRDGKLQSHVVELLVSAVPGMMTTRWRAKVREAFADTEEVREAEDEFWEYLTGFAYIPDGFVIDKEAMRLDFFEVEVTSLLTDTKLQAYAEFKTVMDFYGIEFSLFTVNQHGHISEVFLLPHYLDWIRKNMNYGAVNED